MKINARKNFFKGTIYEQNGGSDDVDDNHDDDDDDDDDFFSSKISRDEGHF